MEPQPTEDGNRAAGGSANMVCRQSSTRWTPTTDQIRILKELYYNKGVRSPSAEQIQRICLQLKRYGKIEGKNVFYWFQNHKARERQKKRFTSDVHVPMQRSGLVGNANCTNWKPEDQYMNMNNKYSNICQGNIPNWWPTLTFLIPWFLVLVLKLGLLNFRGFFCTCFCFFSWRCDCF